MLGENIIILEKNDLLEAWGSLTEICKEHGFSYHYLKRKKFPFTYKGFNFIKVKYRRKFEYN